MVIDFALRRHPGGAVFSVLCAVALLPGFPPAGAASARAQARSTVEVSAGWASLTRGHGAARGINARLTHPIDAGTVLYADLGVRSDFGDTGFPWALSATHLPVPGWRVHGGVGGGFSSDAVPSRVVHAQLARLVDAGIPAWLGAHARYLRWPAGPEERGAGVSVEAHVAAGAVIQAELRWAWSEGTEGPARRYALAATQGREGRRYLTLRVDTGRELYQPLGANAPLMDFRSTAVTAGARVWLKPRAGILANAHFYSNPSYERSGLELGGFHQF